MSTLPCQFKAPSDKVIKLITSTGEEQALHQISKKKIEKKDCKSYLVSLLFKHA